MNIPRFILSLYIRYWQPLGIPLKRANRLAMFGKNGLADLTMAKLDTNPNAICSSSACQGIIRASTKKLSSYQSQKNSSSSILNTRGVCSAIDLSRFINAEAFDSSIQRANSYPLRSMRKAKRVGYWTAEIIENDFQHEIGEIRGSKLFRTGGISPHALFRHFVSEDTQLRRHVTKPGVDCPQHWTRCWGVFTRIEMSERMVASSKNEDPYGGATLVGWCKLRRAGNFVIVMEFMGHGDHLGVGVMDLLFFDILKWIFARGADCTGNLQYVIYGIIEHSSVGLANWKRRRGFLPTLIDEL